MHAACEPPKKVYMGAFTLEGDDSFHFCVGERADFLTWLRQRFLAPKTLVDRSWCYNAKTCWAAA